MNRFVMRHPETAGVALIPESSIRIHKAAGWLRVSDAIAEESTHSVDLDAYVDAPDLDAPDLDAAAEPAAEAVTEAAPPTAKPKEK
jgi:hypothetical protein